MRKTRIKPTTIERDGIFAEVVSGVYPELGIDTHNATGEAHGLENISIEIDHEGCEEGVQKHRQHYLGVDCPLDESKDQRPSR